MKSIKKLSALVALILCVTIGGVYAAWTYAADAGLTESVNKSVSLTPAAQQGSIGTYEVLYQDFSLLIDQKSNTNPVDYTPVLIFYPSQNTNGDLKFKFTPTSVASDEVRANGVESHVQFSSTLSHEGQPIFAFPLVIDIGTADDNTAPIKWTAEADGTFTCIIPNADLGNYITLAYTAKLDTFAKYSAFENSLANGTISIKIFNNYANN